VLLLLLLLLLLRLLLHPSQGAAAQVPAAH
jgi:hypothetical protein